MPLSCNTSAFGSILTTNIDLNENLDLNFYQFHHIIEDKAYSPIAGCVLEHILHSEELTSGEKLLYLLADSLALTRGNNHAERAIIISATNLAKKLNRSKSQIFIMQKGLEAKGYFNISRDSNKFGKNKNNVIYPTLPDDVFASLCQEPNQFRMNNNEYANYLPNQAKLLDDGKRRYLDNTKLFIKINHQLLNLIVAEQQLSSRDKLLWLGLYLKCYKQYIKNDTQGNKYFSCTISYLELQHDYHCSKASLSKNMTMLETLGFIHRQHLYVKNDNDDDNLHDKSLWTIVLSLPSQHQPQMLALPTRGVAKVKATTKLSRPILSKTHHDPADATVDNQPHNQATETLDHPQLGSDISYIDPYVAKSGLLLTKDLKLNIKNQDKKDAKLKFLKIPVTKENPTIVLSEFNKNYVEKEHGSEIHHSDPTLAPKKTKPTKAVTARMTSGRGLKTFHPLNELQVDKLNHLSGRSFSVNFANELLLKLASRYPAKTFLSRNHLMSYMSKAFRYELHQATLVNNPNFRFAVNHPASFETARIEHYLAEVEYSRDTSSYAQLRRKIAGIFAPSIAYQLLSVASFDYQMSVVELGEGQGQRAFAQTGGLDELEEARGVDDLPQATSEELILGEAELIDQLEAIMVVQLPAEVTLSAHQQQSLDKAIEAVYGLVQVIYQQDKNLSAMVGGKRLATNHHQLLGTTPPLRQSPIASSFNPSFGDSATLEDAPASSPWQQIRWQLKQIFGNEIDQAWFAKLTTDDDLSAGELILYAPTNFMRDWITNRYGRQINELCQSLLGVKFCTINTAN